MLFAVNWVYKVLGKTSFYPMDDADACRDTKIKWLKDDEHAIVLGKTKPPHDNVVKDCSLKLAPSEKNKNKFLQLRFDSFYINDCDVELEIHQAPSSSPEDTKELMLLNCRSYNPPVLYGEENHQIHLKLKREEKFKVDYNFRINVTSTEGRVESGISSPLIIGLAVGGGVALLLLLIVLLKYLSSRRNSQSEEPAGNQSDPAVRYSQVGNNTVPNDSVQIGEDRNKPPLIGYDACNGTGPPSPEHCPLLSNGSPGVQNTLQSSNGGVVSPPNDANDAEVSILASAPPQDLLNANNSNAGENQPEREHSFRAARGNSPPPSYEDAVGFPVQLREHSPDSAQYANVPTETASNANRLTV